MSSTKSLIGSSMGVVEAPYEQVVALLLNVNSGMFTGRSVPFILSEANLTARSATLEIRGGPEIFTVYSTGEHVGRLVNIEVSNQEPMVAIYGGYWYRGEYTLVRHSKGCIITLSIYNIAPGITKIFVPFLKEYRMIRKGYNHNKPQNPAFESLLQNLSNHFGCDVSLT